MATCPNCQKNVPGNALQCPACTADFTAENGWKPLEEGQQWTGPKNWKPRRLGRYVPNWIPYGTRMWNLAGVVFLIVFVVVSLVIGKMYIPGKRGAGLLFTGLALYFGVVAAICAALNLLTTLIDHLDTRDNEDDYQFIDLITKVLAWGFFALAVLSSCTTRKY